MISFDRIQRLEFDYSELVSIITDQEFDRHRAGKWMEDHFVFTLQAVFLYLITIFALKKWMETREPFKLQLPVAVWNCSIALISGLCAAAITPQFFASWYNEGFNATLCTIREEVYTGACGRAFFILILSRLPEFIDTLFIVLRKQPLLFIHYYHHAFTLCFTWHGYPYFAPAALHPAYANSLIHTVMYSYYLVTTLKYRPPPFVARAITTAQIVQFVYIFYGLVHVTVLTLIDESCQQDLFGLAITWFMDLSYLYLFIDFYMNKYKGTTKTKKVD